MADDVTLPGTGVVVAADEIGGKKFQRVKATFGADGTATDVSSSNPMPVTVIGGGAGDASATNQVTTQGLVGALTETAPASDTASSGLNGRLQRIAQRLTTLIGLFPTSLGAKAASASLAVTQSTEDAAQLGSLTETAPASDTASSGLNGRLQRIAQRLTTMLASLGSPSDAAWTSGDGSHTSLLKAIYGLLNTPLTELAKTPLLTASDLSQDSKTTSGGTATLVAAVSGQTTRLHAYAVIVPGAGTLEIRDGTTMKRRHIFPDKGGIVRDFSSRPYAKTSTNAALTMSWSGSGDAQIDFDYVTSA